ncbi:uncharacterized protein G2W53_030369 [Senna tora]|uniref:Uncharacterized protein n=1 Tax=Senna tora TaxID=362788 RepID=A0A834T6V0_9FABA|nr:uncharacterized protein G2W53_030369 [Senna tora]
METCVRLENHMRVRKGRKFRPTVVRNDWATYVSYKKHLFVSTAKCDRIRSDGEDYILVLGNLPVIKAWPPGEFVSAFFRLPFPSLSHYKSFSPSPNSF